MVESWGQEKLFENKGSAAHGTKFAHPRIPFKALYPTQEM